MSDGYHVRFDRDLVAKMLASEEVQTLRLESMGQPDDEGFFTPAFYAESMDPWLPDPWIFDGYRRVYDDGKPLGIWQARAINLDDAEIEEGTGRQKASFQVGQGTTMVEARDALLEVMW
jgi:hypothetical protein